MSLKQCNPLKQWPSWPGLKYLLLGIAMALIIGLGSLFRGLQIAAQQPVDTYLVLGGSIRRELYVAQRSTLQPSLPVLITGGSQPPCIRLIYEAAQAPIDQVWLENCAQSTLGNFTFTVPLLKQWQVQHIKLVTSGSHTQRAIWMARIILGAHRIWVEPDIVSEEGIPGNQESSLKTTVDIVRSLAWAGISQVYAPDCREIIPLTAVNLTEWRARGFKCEHQAGIEGS